MTPMASPDAKGCEGQCRRQWKGMELTSWLSALSTLPSWLSSKCEWISRTASNATCQFSQSKSPPIHSEMKVKQSEVQRSRKKHKTWSTHVLAVLDTERVCALISTKWTMDRHSLLSTTHNRRTVPLHWTAGYLAEDLVCSYTLWAKRHSSTHSRLPSVTRWLTQQIGSEVIVHFDLSVNFVRNSLPVHRILPVRIKHLW